MSSRAPGRGPRAGPDHRAPCVQPASTTARGPGPFLLRGPGGPGHSQHPGHHPGQRPCHASCGAAQSAQPTCPVLGRELTMTSPEQECHTPDDLHADELDAILADARWCDIDAGVDRLRQHWSTMTRCRRRRRWQLSATALLALVATSSALYQILPGPVRPGPVVAARAVGAYPETRVRRPSEAVVAAKSTEHDGLGGPSCVEKPVFGQPLGPAAASRTAPDMPRLTESVRQGMPDGDTTACIATGRCDRPAASQCL